MRRAPVSVLRWAALAALCPLAACATNTAMPAEVIRYHLGEPLARGTIRVEPMVAEGATPSIEFKTYAAAVETQLLRNGYSLPAAGAQPELVATVAFLRANRVGPPRQSPVSIGLGGGGFSGGRRGGGFGLGGGIGFPIGGGGRNALIETELGVTIKRRVDQSPIWEGRAHTIANARRAEAETAAQAQKLATALFTGFPGESGRTVEVK